MSDATVAMAMTIEQFDAELRKIVDWYVEEVVRVQAGFSDRLDAATGRAEGLPAHLTKASMEHCLRTLEAELQRRGVE